MSKVGPRFQRTEPEPGSSPTGVSHGASRQEMRLECEQQAGWDSGILCTQHLALYWWSLTLRTRWVPRSHSHRIGDRGSVSHCSFSPALPVRSTVCEQEHSLESVAAA